MKHFIYILLIAFSITAIVIGCSTYDGIQVGNSYARLVLKEKHRYLDYEVVRQYWQDTRRNLVYWEELPKGDTGSHIGEIRTILVTR